MRTLDNQIYFYVNIPTGTTLGVYSYSLYTSKDNGSTENLVFSGNFYYDGVETEHRFDLTDVIRSIKKTLDISSIDGYSDSAELLRIFRLKVYLSNSTRITSWYPIAMVYEYPHKLSYMNNENIFIYGVTGHTVALQGLEGNKPLKLIPRYPLKETQQYCYVQSFITGDSSTFTLAGSGDGTYHQTFTVNSVSSDIYSRYISCDLSEYIDWDEVGADEHITITDTNNYYGSKVIAQFDKCYSHYYLMWQDRFGGIQSQPFNDKMTYSETFSVTETQNYANQRKKSFIQVQPKWKLNTDWISEDAYPIYESIFVSPILKLYDAYEDKIYDVIVSGDYTEKTYRNEKKLLNLTLNLEAISKQNIIY